MTRYTATIRHHSISRARVVAVGETLHGAKAAATREFGDGFNDHTIVIFDTARPEWDQEVSSRIMTDRKWQDWR